MIKDSLYILNKSLIDCVSTSIKVSVKKWYSTWLINSAVYNDIVKVRKSIYMAIYNKEGLSNAVQYGRLYTFDIAKDLQSYYVEKYPHIYKLAIRIIDNKSKRANRVKDKISDIVLNMPSVFLTLTFSNDSLSCLSEIVRRKYVADYCRSCSPHYVANIDFGDKNGREHYHAIVGTQKCDYKAWIYGNIKGEKVILSGEESLQRLSHYIAKLTNHAIKESTRNSRIIYSRN